MYPTRGNVKFSLKFYGSRDQSGVTIKQNGMVMRFVKKKGNVVVLNTPFLLFVELFENTPRLEPAHTIFITTTPSNDSYKSQK